MKDYNNSKIFKIQKRGGNNNDYIYIGSTTYKNLSSVMAQHKSNYKKSLKEQKTINYGSKVLFKMYGMENCEIELIETINCNCMDELRMITNKYISINKTVVDYPINEDENNTKIEKEYEEFKNKEYERQNLIVLENIKNNK